MRNATSVTADWSLGDRLEAERSRTFPGIAQAMAQQWGDVKTLRRVA